MTHPLLAGLNPEQARAAATTEGPLLVLAGAGSGKTRVLTHRLAYLIEAKGVHPSNLLAVTFTNKAAAEMRERVHSLVGSQARRIRLSTFHSFCVAVLRQDIRHLGISQRFTILDIADQRALLKGLMERERVDTKKWRPNRVLSRIDYAKNRLIPPGELEQESAGDPSPHLYPLYEAALRAVQGLDFNDLINLTVKLWTEHADVRAKWSQRYRYVMVDEYQDTNRAQFQLIKLLAGTHRNVMVVGDDDQSIYAFRGADVRNILEFETVFGDATVVRLEQNYRSTGNILKAANAVVANNRERMEKALWTDKGDGDPIKMLVGHDEREQAELVVGKIRQLVRGGHRYGDLAIIYRTNAASRHFEEQLVRAEIPHVLVGATKFYERREIRDLVAYLKLILNPADDVAFQRVINSPRRGVGPKALEQLREEAAARSVPLLEAARWWSLGSGRGKKGARAFVAVLDRLRKAVDDTAPGELVMLAARESGYLDWLEAEGTEEAKGRRENIEELAREVGEALTDQAELLDDAGEDPLQRLQLFLDQASLSSQADELPDDDQMGRVTLLTAHLAKGLEFPAVFVVNLHEGGFPHFMSLNTEADLQEERRLVYVAFTRAQERLFVCRPRRRFNLKSRETTEAEPSRFLREIPTDVIDWQRPQRLGDRSSARRRPLGRNPFDRSPGDAPGHTPSFRRRAAAAPPAPEPAHPTGAHRTRTPEGPDDLCAGARVLHKKFGLGSVVKATGSPSNLKLVVQFDSGVRKNLLARFARLELVDA